MLRRLLFVCSRNRLRSPTAERVLGALADVETDSAGLAPDADAVSTNEQVEWADIVFVMERAHHVRLSRVFKKALRGKKVVCLEIPDRYDYMQPELVSLLERRAAPHLR